MDIVPWILVLALAIVVFSGVRIASESERFAVSVLGRYMKLAGPGLLFRLPGSPQTWTRVKLGDIGQYLGDGLIEIRGVSFPVEVDDASEGDSVRLASFRDGKILAAKTSET